MTFKKPGLWGLWVLAAWTKQEPAAMTWATWTMSKTRTRARCTLQVDALKRHWLSAPPAGNRERGAGSRFLLLCVWQLQLAVPWWGLARSDCVAAGTSAGASARVAIAAESANLTPLRNGLTRPQYGSYTSSRYLRAAGSTCYASAMACGGRKALRTARRAAKTKKRCEEGTEQDRLLLGCRGLVAGAGAGADAGAGAGAHFRTLPLNASVAMPIAAEDKPTMTPKNDETLSCADTESPIVRTRILGHYVSSTRPTWFCGGRRRKRRRRRQEEEAGGRRQEAGGWAGLDEDLGADVERALREGGGVGGGVPVGQLLAYDVVGRRAGRQTELQCRTQSKIP